MIPCLWTDMLHDCEPEEAIRIIGDAGFRQVEFGCNHERHYLEEREDEGRRLESIVRAAERAHVRIVQMHGRLANFCDPATDCAANIAWAHRSLRRAGALGVRWVVLHPGTTPNVGTDPEEWEYVRRRNVELFRSFLQTATEVGVGIAIENMSQKKPRFGATVGDLSWLLDQLDSDQVGVCWDTGHANITGVDQGRALRMLGRRLVALHIDDNDSLSDQHFTPGRGKIDWPSVIQALRDINYSGPFNLEVPGEARVTPPAARPAMVRYLAEFTRLMVDMEIAKEATAS